MQPLYNQKSSRNAFTPLPSSTKSYQLNSSGSATARTGSRGNCLAKVPSGLNNEIEFMDIKLKCELISHKLSKLKNIVLPITDSNIKKFRTRNYNFEHITFHARTPLNYGKGYNGVQHGEYNTFDIDFNMLNQNKSELTKDNKHNDNEDGDNLSDIVDNIVDAFEIEGGDKGNESKQDNIDEGGSKSKGINKEESINIQDECDLNGSEKKKEKDDKEKSSSKKKKKIKKKVLKKVKKVKEHTNEIDNNNNEDIEEEIEEEIEVEETEEEEDDEEIEESEENDNGEKVILRSRKKKKLSKDKQEKNEDNNTKTNEIVPNTNSNLDKQNSPQEEDTDGIISQIMQTAYANTDPKQLNNQNNQITTNLININEYNEEHYNHNYQSAQQPIKKGVTFSDESTVKIQYKDTDIITKLEIYDINENKLPFKPRNINRYLTLLMSEQEEDFPKPCILNSGDNSLLYSALKTHGKSSATKKKILKSLNQKNMIRKNIEMIQEISKRKSIYNIKAPNKRKGIKKPNCKKFRDNPQHFFTETLCERMIYAYDLKIEDIKDENEVRRLGKSHSPNKVRHFNVHEEANEFSEDKSKTSANGKQSEEEEKFKKNIANVKIHDTIEEDEQEDNCGDSNKKQTDMSSDRKNSL